MSLIPVSGGTSSNAGGFYPNPIDQSLRFNDDDSAYLSRTPASAGNRKTMTFSMWVKRGSLAASYFTLFSAGAASPSPRAEFGFNNNAFYVILNPSGSSSTTATTNAVFRDASAWYHIVVAMDTTQATSTNRLKVWVNSVEQTFSAYAVPTQNTDLPFNNNVAQNIGRYIDGSQFFDGYLAEVHFTDGTAYDADAFGEFKNGVWVAKTPSVTYGTNGFYLDFATSGDGTTEDVSGNGNNWTENNITASDVVLDSPTDNFCTLNGVSIGADATLADGNLQISYGSSATRNATMGTFGMSSGKWYWEVEITASSASPTTAVVGITNNPSASDVANYPGFAANGWGYSGSDANKYNNGSGTAYGATFAATDVIGFAFDADSGSITAYKNGVSQGVMYSGLAANTYYPAIGDGTAASTFTAVANFGQLGFTYTPPTGYLALSTANLPDPAIDPAQGSSPQDYFNTVLYTGNGTAIGSGGNAITGVGFQPDWVWIKERSGAASHGLYDAVRGVTEQLESDTTAAETTESEGLTAFGTDGFTVGSLAQVNTNTDTYVAWNWKAGGTGVSNTDGTITSTVSANTTSGFSIVSWAGTNGTGTIGHGLSSAPNMIIVKDRGSATNWAVYHSSIGNTKGLLLNTTDPEQTNSLYWNNTSPTSTVFSVNQFSNYTGNTIAYCFHSVEGFSKFGSYVGNGSADGPMIFTGFRPAFLLIKRTDANGYSWYIWDSERDAYNEGFKELYPNLSNAEGGGTRGDFLSNGFKVRTSGAAFNASGGTYIYMAFSDANGPFKYSNAR